MTDPHLDKERIVATWMAINAESVTFEEVSGADVTDGVVRYVFQRKEDGSFGAIDVDGRKIFPASSMVYVAGNTLHVQVG